jgi:glycosyltransferase involved in cell wall biosynthesis
MSDHTSNFPKVSIGLPVYNGELFLKTAIDSLLNQSYSNFELIISDNNSTDSTQRICQEYAKNDDRIRYIKQEKNIGPYPNFYFVLSQSKGKYFMWAAADDFWDILILYKKISLCYSAIQMLFAVLVKSTHMVFLIAI